MKFLTLTIFLFLSNYIISYDRIIGKDFATRSEVIATNGMAATSHPLATQTAIDVLKDGGNFVLLDMTRPLNRFTKMLHRLGTFIILHFIGIATLNFKEYRFLYTSLDMYEAPEIFLKKNNFTSFTLERMGIFGFVYLAVLENN